MRCPLVSCATAASRSRIHAWKSKGDLRGRLRVEMFDAGVVVARRPVPGGCEGGGLGERRQAVVVHAHRHHRIKAQQRQVSRSGGPASAPRAEIWRRHKRSSWRLSSEARLATRQLPSLGWTPYLD